MTVVATSNARRDLNFIEISVVNGKKTCRTLLPSRIHALSAQGAGYRRAAVLPIKLDAMKTQELPGKFASREKLLCSNETGGPRRRNGSSSVPSSRKRLVAQPLCAYLRV